MKKSTTSILIYAVVFLGVMNIATFSTIGYHIYNSRIEKTNTTITTEGNTQGYNGRYFKDKLLLSRSQMDLFQEINTGFRTNARRINIELIAHRKQMLNEMQQQNPDTVILNSFSDSIGILHKDLKRHTYKYYIGIRGICSGQQQVELDKIFKGFFINELHIGNRGNMGNRGQRRHGQQRNNN